MSVMPTLEEGKDLILVHRFNVTGARRTEVWTKRKFEPGELMIAPWTHEIKERLWTTGLAVSLGVLKTQCLAIVYWRWMAGSATN